MLGSLGFPEIMLIFVLALLIFGPSKLPDIGRSLGKGLREFKKATSGIMDSVNEGMNESQPTQKAKTQALPPPKPSNPIKPLDQEEIIVNLEDEKAG